MKILEVKDLKNYGIEIPKKGKVIVDIYTSWCAPCRILSKVLENFEEEGLIKTVKVNLDNNQEFGQDLGIHSIPTLLFFKDGKLLDNDIEIKGKPIVNQGVMIGAAGELILREIIKRM
ncbi:MAG: Thioredoxin C-1 [Promethearchaeota archaeon]|nr:MAG: Thioredoxin C-1 [Candidatus Lokiarchaeota archaeon]